MDNFYGVLDGMILLQLEIHFGRNQDLNNVRTENYKGKVTVKALPNC